MTYGNGLTPPSGDYGYRPQYASPMAQPHWGHPATITQAPPHQVNVFANVTMKPGRHVPWWIWVILGFVLLLVVAYFTAGLGQGASTLGFILALVPLAIVITGVYLIDRWEPEPLRLMIFALAWGGIVSIALTLLVALVTDDFLPRGFDGIFIASVIRAPIVEEITKGLGLLLIMVLGKRALDGPVDGVVYGALVGAGFAFTENIQYFGVQFATGGAESLGPIFFMRGIMSPFCHAMFTACTGYALGLAARKGRRGVDVMPHFLVGLLAAIALHALWNGSTFVGDISTFYLLYAVVQFPLFITFIFVIRWLKIEEARLTRARLGDYAMAGWFTPQEVEMLATKPGRATAMHWARSLPGNRAPIMKRFIADANELAATRQRAISGRDPQAGIDEHVLLQRTMATRNQLLAH